LRSAAATLADKIKNRISPDRGGFDFQHRELMEQAGARFSLPTI
jgi:hypothetical protein